MIILLPSEKKFLKDNSKILSDIFSKGIEDLKEELILCEPEKREAKIESIKWFKRWLLTVKIFSGKKIKEKTDNFI